MLPPSKVRRGQVFAAVDGAALVGLIVLIRASDHLLIENIAVDPTRQGTGVGRALLEYAEACAREHGLKEVRLHTNEAMIENLSVYPRRGYSDVDRRTESGLRRVYYAKRLNRQARREALNRH